MPASDQESGYFTPHGFLGVPGGDKLLPPYAPDEGLSLFPVLLAIRRFTADFVHQCFIANRQN
jgi:hypothetical protein